MIGTKLRTTLFVLGSEPVKFLVQGKTFWLHPALASAVSKPLGALIDSSMREAQGGHVIDDDTDLKTFTCFTSWLYESDYKGKSPVKRIRPEFPSDIGVETMTAGPTRDNDSAVAKMDMSATKAGENCMLRMMDCRQDLPADVGMILAVIRFNMIASENVPPRECSPKNLAQSQTVSKFMTAFIGMQFSGRDGEILSRKRVVFLDPKDYDYTETLLCHAKVYVYADKYQISRLKSHSASRLHGLLCHFPLRNDTAGQIFALVEYVYKNTVASDSEELRKVIKAYIGWKMKFWLANDKLRQLLTDNAELMRDFLSLVEERLATP